MWNRVPLVVILGPTGVGKSKLSLELAKRFSGEIISADSMQVYKGLDVITNKVTPEEQSIAPHHLLDFLDPLKNYTVVHFRNKALPIIKDIQTAGKLPIVVGGTHYYIESLLWQVLVDDENAEVADTKFDAVTAQALLQELESWAEFLRNLTRDRFVSLSDKTRQAAADVFSSIEDYAKDGVAHCLHSNASEVAIACEHLATSVPNVKARIRELLEAARPDLGDFRVDFEMRRVQDEINRKLHDRLRGIDPKTAAALHPNSRRKILRALQIHASKGQPQSDILGAQRSQDGGSSLGGPLRFKNTVMLWLRCEKDILDKRLDDRVDDMMNRGLVQELLDFHNKYNEDRLKNMDRSLAYTQGIFQSIGFKEFHPYLTLNEEERGTEKGKQLLTQGIEELKKVTKRYAKRQNKWITNRFIRNKDREVPEIYGLDASNLEDWDVNVLKPAVDLVGARLGLPGFTSTIQPLPGETPIDNSLEENFCNVCQRVFIEKQQWEVHLKSNRHKRELTKRKRKEKQNDDANKRARGASETSKPEPLD